MLREQANAKQRHLRTVIQSYCLKLPFVQSLLAKYGINPRLATLPWINPRLAQSQSQFKDPALVQASTWGESQAAWSERFLTFFLSQSYMMTVQIGLYLLLCELDLLRWNPRIKLTFLSLQFQNWVINVWKLERGLRIPKKRSHLLKQEGSGLISYSSFSKLEREEENVMSPPQRIETFLAAATFESWNICELLHIWSDWSRY